MRHHVVQVAGDAETLLARSSPRLLLDGARPRCSTLPPEPEHLARARQHQQPGGEAGGAGEAGPLGAEELAQPEERHEPGGDGEPRQPAPARHEHGDEGHDESREHRPSGVVEEPEGQGRAEGDAEDGARETAPPEEGDGPHRQQGDRQGVQAVAAVLMMTGGQVGAQDLDDAHDEHGADVDQPGRRPARR